MVLYQDYVTNIYENKFLAFVGQPRKIILGRDINKTDDLKDVVYMGRVGEITQEMRNNVTLSLNLMLVDNKLSVRVILKLYDTYRFAVVALGDYVAVTNARFEITPEKMKFYDRKKIQTRSISVDERLTDAVVWIMTTSVPRCAREATFTYTELADLRDRTISNFFGVVTIVSPVIKTRGTSFMCLIFITDPSISTDGKEIPTTIYFINDIPRIKRGHIVRIIRTSVASDQGRMTAILFAPPDIVTWSSRDLSFVPCTTNDAYLSSTEDREHVINLRRWIRKKRRDLLLPPEEQPLLNRMSHYGEFCESVVGHRMNIVCQMIDLLELDDTFKILVVWDGTRPCWPLYQWPTNGMLYNTTITSIIKNYLIFIKVRNKDCEELLNIKPFRILYVENVSCLSSESTSDPSSIIYFLNTDCNNDSNITVCDASQSQYYLGYVKIG